MSKTEEQGSVYQVRRLTDRWVQPLGGEVISTHDTREAAFHAYDQEPRTAEDGTGRSTKGSYVPNVVVRVNRDGSEEAVARRAGDGRW